MPDEKPPTHTERVRTERIISEFFQAPRGTVKRFLKEASRTPANPTKQLDPTVAGQTKHSTELQTSEQRLEPSTRRNQNEESSKPTLPQGLMHVFIFNENGLDSYWEIPANFIDFV